MEIAKFWSQNSKTPEPTDKKLALVITLAMTTPHAKTQNDRPTGGVAAYAWKSPSRGF